MSISVSAFAQTVGTANAEKGSITISNAAKGETYKIFKLSQDHHFKWWFENSPKRAEYIAA